MIRNYILKISYDVSLNKCNHINLPSSILEIIEGGTEELSFPLCFKVTEESSSISFFCSVNEFSADEDTIEVPYLLADHLGLQDLHVVQLKCLRNLQKAHYVEFEPQSESFFKLKDYESLLENRLSKYQILYLNQFLFIHTEDDNVEFLKIRSIRPDWDNVNYAEFDTDNQDCYQIINIDINVDIYNKFAVERYYKDQKSQKRELAEMKKNDYNILKYGNKLSYSPLDCQKNLSLEEIRTKRLLALKKKNEG